MSGVATAVGVGAGLSYLGSQQAAGAAGDAAAAQQQSAAAQLAFAKDTQERAMGIAGKMQSPEELRALSQSLNVQRRNMMKQEQLFRALDPAILEASKQALDIMQGRESKFLQPLRQQRQRQRQTLLNTLREQLGPGAETSTAGIQALTKFDQETAGGLAQGQQQSLGQLFGMGQSGAVNRGQLGNTVSQFANIGSAFGTAQNRSRQAQLSALVGTSPFVNQAGQAVTQAAGGQHLASGIQGQAMANFGQQLVGGALGYATAKKREG